MIPLHVHSYYTFLQGAVSVDDLVKKAKSCGLTALALTDTNSMHGLIQFAKKSKEASIKSLLGTYIDDPDNKENYAIFIARNIQGYADICRIITTRKLKDDFSLVKLLQDDFPDLFIIIRSLELLKKIPHRKNIFAELISTPKEKRKTRKLYEYCMSKGIECIASNPIYFLRKEDYIIHRTLTAMKDRGTLQNLNEDNLVDEEYYFKDPQRLQSNWKKFPQVLNNIDYIVENCKVDLELGEFKFPQYNSPSGEDSFSFLWRVAFEGLTKRYSSITREIIDRLKMELDVINDLNLSDYFLVVWDILREAKRRRMMTIGRGSAANSLVSYCLGFTEVDPIKYNFYFERFLNKGRHSPPDVDLDFSWKERDEIVKYVFERYGYERVAFISTHVTFRARSAFRETAKVFGIADGEISQMSKFIPWTDARNLPEISKLFPEARSLKLNHEPWLSIVNIATRLANFPRHLSIHPGGIVIAPNQITNYTALEYAQNKGVGLIITQPDMYGIEDLGLVKIDLLSQRSLGVLRDTLKQLEVNSLSNISQRRMEIYPIPDRG